MILTILENNLKERRRAVSKYGREIMFHGTTSYFLKSILSNGLVPSPKQKVWQSDTSSYSRSSRESYGGIYFTKNFVTALSSARIATEKFKGNAVIVVAELQPRTALPDEDSFTFMTNYVLDYAVGEKGKYVGDAESMNVWTYIYYLQNDKTYKRKEQDFIDKYKADIEGKMKDVVPEESSGINKALGELFISALKRRIAHIEKDSLTRLISGAIDDWNKAKIEAEKLISNKEEYEQEYMKALNSVIKLLKRETYKHKDDFSKSYRITEPVGFSGRNKIIAVIELPNYLGGRDSNTPTILDVKYGKMPNEFIDAWKERIGANYEIVSN